MDTVYEYKENLINFLLNLDENTTVTLELEDLFYLLISNNPRDDENLLRITKKLIKAFKMNKATANIKSLKKLINYTQISGLENTINTKIYNLLLIDQVIKKNENILRESYDENLYQMNSNLKNSYNIEKNNFINMILD